MPLWIGARLTDEGEARLELAILRAEQDRLVAENARLREEVESLTTRLALAPEPHRHVFMFSSTNTYQGSPPPETTCICGVRYSDVHDPQATQEGRDG